MAGYYNILRGGTFTFKVGPEEEVFVVHKQAIEKWSPVLAALMNNGHMEESTTGVAKLEHTDPRIFARFVEFTYTGMYCMHTSQALMKLCPKFLLICHRCEISQIWWPGMPPNDHGTVQCNSCCTNKFSVYELVWTDRVAEIEDERLLERGPVDLDAPGNRFDAILRWYNLSVAQFHYLYDLEHRYKIYGPRRAEDPRLTASDCNNSEMRHCLDSLQVDALPILLHAKLYVFCQKYLVDSLKQYCLKMLDKDLSRLELTEDSVAGIEELIFYIYENTIGLDEQKTGDNGQIPKSDELRDCILKFMVTNSHDLTQIPSFKALLCGGGKFVADFCRELSFLMRL